MSLSQPLVLVYGDIMLDILVTGTCTRPSPEAPGAPVLLSDKMTMLPGGAANVAVNLASLGANVALIGGVGNDNAGRVLVDLLDGFATNLLVRSVQTTAKTRLVAEGKMLMRLDTETPQSLDEKEEAATLLLLRDRVGKAHAVVISDYAKGMVTPKLAQALIEAAFACGIPVVVDSKTPAAKHFHGASVLKPNSVEIARALDCAEPKTDEEADICASSLWCICGGDAVVLTRGAAGMSVAGPWGRAVHIEAHHVSAVDVTGAGDTVCAALTIALARGDRIDEAARFANAAAAVVVTKWGTCAPTPEEVRFFYDRNTEVGSRRSSALARERAEGWVH